MATILIVDDEEIDRAFIRDILEPEGHQLLFASDGGTAHEICKGGGIDLAITDLAMPKFNGLRFIRELREGGFLIPVIAVSGWAKDQLDLALQYGADLVLTKPLDKGGLLRSVDEALSVQGGPSRKDPWLRVRS